MMIFPVISFGQNKNDSISTVCPIIKYKKDSLCCSNKEEAFPLEHPEVYPEFPGGNKEIIRFVTNNLKFPKEALEAGVVSGRIGISFIVEKDGSITDIKVVRSFEEHFDKVIVSAFKRMPKWKPGENKGKIVRTKITWFMNYDYKG